jgi:hypothetical protein
MPDDLITTLRRAVLAALGRSPNSAKRLAAAGRWSNLPPNSVKQHAAFANY